LIIKEFRWASQCCCDH